MTPPPFGTFPKIHPFWSGDASLRVHCRLSRLHLQQTSSKSPTQVTERRVGGLDNLIQVTKSRFISGWQDWTEKDWSKTEKDTKMHFPNYTHPSQRSLAHRGALKYSAQQWKLSFLFLSLERRVTWLLNLIKYIVPLLPPLPYSVWGSYYHILRYYKHLKKPN